MLAILIRDFSFRLVSNDKSATFSQCPDRRRSQYFHQLALFVACLRFSYLHQQFFLSCSVVGNFRASGCSLNAFKRLLTVYERSEIYSKRYVLASAAIQSLHLHFKPASLTCSGSSEMRNTKNVTSSNNRLKAILLLRAVKNLQRTLSSASLRVCEQKQKAVITILKKY